MSFKRAGDDLNLLNGLKHKRVVDLLSHHIPEDEAKLLSNGRLTCLVCSQRPIFDTINVLATHRKGKKHLLELSKYIKRQQELEFEVVKKQHYDGLRETQSKDDPDGVSLVDSMILGSKEYHTRDLRRRLSDGGRRIALEIPSFGEETFNLESGNVQVLPSSASQIRRYLKKLPRKASLEQAVERAREKYPEANSETPTESGDHDRNSSKDNAALEPHQHPSVMSGWIKDKFGQWVKDPEAEFESDEEAPSFTSS